MQVSFARDGKPTGTWGPNKWDEMSLSQIKGDQALKFYNINKNNCSSIDEPFGSRMSFWDNLPLNEGDREVGISQKRSDMHLGGMMNMGDIFS